MHAPAAPKPARTLLGGSALRDWLRDRMVRAAFLPARSGGVGRARDPSDSKEAQERAPARASQSHYCGDALLGTDASRLASWPL